MFSVLNWKLTSYCHLPCIKIAIYTIFSNSLRKPPLHHFSLRGGPLLDWKRWTRQPGFCDYEIESWVFSVHLFHFNEGQLPCRLASSVLAILINLRRQKIAADISKLGGNFFVTTNWHFDREQNYFIFSIFSWLY
jgi:hypothetical protein